jgi:hypothetical protein
MSKTPTPPGSRDVQFLTEEFGIPPFKAAGIVARQREQAEALTDAELKRQQEADPLADIPTPTPPSNDRKKEHGEDMMKPLTGGNNLRGGG